jgi:hypothetical protein
MGGKVRSLAHLGRLARLAHPATQLGSPQRPAASFSSPPRAVSQSAVGYVIYASGFSRRRGRMEGSKTVWESNRKTAFSGVAPARGRLASCGGWEAFCTQFALERALADRLPSLGRRIKMQTGKSELKLTLGLVHISTTLLMSPSTGVIITALKQRM